MQFGEAAQDVRRNVLVATASGRAVVRLADPDVGGPVQQPFQSDPGLRAGQRCAGAAVNAAAERQVLARVLALGIESVGVLEPARVAVGGPVDHHHRAAGTEGFVADGGRHPRQPEVALHRALDAQALLDEVRQQAAIATQPLLDVGLVAHHLQRGGQQPHRRLLARGEDVGGHPHDVADLGHRAVRERRRGQPGQHVVARLARGGLRRRSRRPRRGTPAESCSWSCRHCRRRCRGCRGRAARGDRRDPPRARRAGRR